MRHSFAVCSLVEAYASGADVPAFLVKPETLLRWLEQACRQRARKWRARRGAGRPPLPEETVQLVPRLGKENRNWGCVRIQGELAKLGIRVGATTVRCVLRAARPGRAGSAPWAGLGELLRSRAAGVLPGGYRGTQLCRSPRLPARSRLASASFGRSCDDSRPRSAPANRSVLGATGFWRPIARQQ
jgi:hypothetical protein